MGVGGSSDNADLQELHDAWRSKLALRGEAEASALAEAEASALAERARKLDLRKKARRAKLARKLDPRKKAQAKSSRGAEISTTLEPKQPWSRDSPLPPVVKEVEVCPGLEPPVVKEEDEDGEECPGLEPFFFDEAAAVAEHRERTLRLQEEEEEWQRERAALRKIRQYDPKKGRICFTRYHYVDLGEFDLDEESPLGPMRYTDAAIEMVTRVVFKDRILPGGHAPSANVETGLSYLDELCKPARVLSFKLDPASQRFIPTDEDNEDLFFPCNSANILSVKIASSDVGFPINVYGTVIARDILDRKCVYLFRCDRDQSYLILNKEEQLILTGPKRGLALIDTISIETDLKIKGTGKPQKDKQLSKGFVEVKDDRHRVNKEDMLVECSIDSMLSEVVVKCAVENCAVEATIAIEVVQGKFCGEITASTTNSQGSFVLYDSKLISAEMSGKGVIPLLRCVVAVGVKEKLLVTIARAGVCKVDGECTIKFTPSINDRDTAEVTCGSVKMYVKVVWSVIKRLRLDRPSTVVNRLDRPSTVVKRR